MRHILGEPVVERGVAVAVPSLVRLWLRADNPLSVEAVADDAIEDDCGGIPEELTGRSAR
ncbi:hypothetical protein BCEP4_540036 [Burkholderia cepacia]|uniref:hypothetical protein n=1 Tax=Burkholderia cepacia TaxID=292 RepID=UPI0012D8AC8E|nr:hypothetical protein [Burkholderia cepacia]CAG9268987.1 hypothetical protein BCEP4_540036 [Burkholderia cepacia]